MHPTLVKLGPLELHAYGFMLALSFFLGILLAARRAPARGVNPDAVFDCALVIVFAAIVGARAMYVLFHHSEVRGILDAIAVWRGGLTMYGGVLAAMGAAWVHLRRRNIPFLRMADVMAPSLGLGLMVTRIGCFLNGCCYGKPTGAGWGVRFPAHTLGGSVFGDTPLHPTQLYSSAVGLVILLFLLAVDRRRRPEGQLFALYLILEGAGRFGLDFFRYYEANVYVAGALTVNQLIGAGIALVGFVLLVQTVRARQGLNAPAAVAAAAAGDAAEASR
jgi:phosphatidylglycerol:prolipoprotein diacylglycerol transferase